MKKILSLIIFSVIYTSLFCQLLCDQSLWTHVYKPERLQGDKKCATVKGKVYGVIPGDDGGYRVLIKLDAGQPLSLLNDKNMSLAKGCLVAEIICAHRPITQSDAIKSCGTYESRVRVPSLNDHVQVTGFYMLDADPARDWNTLFPVSEIVELQKR